MTLDKLLEQARAQESIQFDQLMSVIVENYNYTPSAFGNGLAPNRVENEAGQNEGSCKLFAFAR
ncbi:MAG: HopJ type III effector protein, partial [Halopseudomonas sp.]